VKADMQGCKHSDFTYWLIKQCRNAHKTYFVSDASRKPRNTVSSSSGASTAVVVIRLTYVGVLMLMSFDTASTVPFPPTSCRK
jgi:hypothetical protein